MERLSIRGINLFLFQETQDVPGHFFHPSSVRIHHEVGHFPVQGLPHGHQALEPPGRIIGMQKGPIVGKSCSRQLLAHGGVKINNRSPAGQCGSILRIEYGSASGSHDHGFETGKILYDGAFPSAEALLALFLEYKRDIDARSFLDFSVAVHERHMQGPSELPAHGSLAGTHRSDEKNVFFCGHRQK
jgi:hypothetical protein